MATSDLPKLAKDKWHGSGLSDDHAKKLKLEVLEAHKVAALGTNFKKAGGLRIPYFDPKGKVTKFYRVRYLEPLPGFAGVVVKPQRYVQPAGTINEVYLPPLLDRPWAEIMEDVSVTVYVTEGELKAASACAAGLACLGLGGVDVWRSQRRGMQLLPVLEQFAWNGRNVVVLYDSDAATNENVVRAERQLARELTSRGSNPAIAALPPSAQGKKQGLDDFIVANGAEALQEVIAQAPTFPEAEALWSLNEEVVYVRDPGLVVVRESGQKLSPANFVAHAYANRHYLEVHQTKKGVSTIKKPLAKRWMEWEQRFELSRITYLPGRPPLHDNMWNTWRGWGLEPKEGDIGPWEWLMDLIFKNDVKARTWFLKWCAYPLQHPGTKLFTSVVIWGAHHGTGKTLIAYTLRRIYGENFVEIGNRELTGGFNEWAENKQFVYGDEIAGSDKRGEGDALKRLITQEHMRINAKYVPSYSIPDCLNYFFTSNHPDTLFLEDTDRRNFIHEVVSKPASEQEYAVYDKWLRDGGAAALFHHLLTLDLAGFNPKAPAPMTTAKKQMIVDNKSDLGMWVHALKEDPEVALKALGEAAATGADLLSPDLLHRAYDPERSSKVTVNGLARELKRSGFRQVNEDQPIRTSLGLKRVYAIRNYEKWANAHPKVLLEHFEKFFGPNSRKF